MKKAAGYGMIAGLGVAVFVWQAEMYGLRAAATAFGIAVLAYSYIAIGVYFIVFGDDK